MSRQVVKLRVVRALNGLCTWVDEVAYRPVVVKITRWLPRWWCCQLAHLSMKLDKRWDTGYWKSANAPRFPTARVMRVSGGLVGWQWEALSLAKSLVPTLLTRTVTRYTSAAGVNWILDPPEIGRSLNASLSMPESEALPGDGAGIPLVMMPTNAHSSSCAPLLSGST